jgi:hypothetical protein
MEGWSTVPLPETISIEHSGKNENSCQSLTAVRVADARMNALAWKNPY